LAVLLATLPAPARAQGAAPVAELTVLRGAVLVSRPGLVRRGEAGDRLALADGERIRSLADSKAHLRFIAGNAPGENGAGAEAIVTGNTTVSVHALRAVRATPPLELLYGAVRARIAGLLGAAAFLRTGTVTVGIKGTDFITYVFRPSATEFIGVEGLIEGVSLSNAEHRLRIGRRQWGEIVAGVPPKPPIRVPDDQWEAALREFSFPP
jgi:hypothetical protein